MMRKIIGKIIDIVLPPKGQEQASKEAPPPTTEVKAVSLEQILAGLSAKHQPSQTYELLVCILPSKMKRLQN